MNTTLNFISVASRLADIMIFIIAHLPSMVVSMYLSMGDRIELLDVSKFPK